MDSEKLRDVVVQVWADIDFEIVAEVYKYWMDYKIYTYIAESEYKYSGEDGPVEKREEAECLFWGRVKWDGCSDFMIGSEQVMYHICKREQAVQLGEALKRVWDMAMREIPYADHESGE